MIIIENIYSYKGKLNRIICLEFQINNIKNKNSDDNEEVIAQDRTFFIWYVVIIYHDEWNSNR